MSDETSKPETVTTSLARKWVLKIAVFLVLLTGFGFYFIYDATVAYPNRGEKSASWHLHQFLAASNNAHSLTLDLGIPTGKTAAEHFAELGDQLDAFKLEASGTTVGAPDANAQVTKYNWLQSLRVLGRLTDERVAQDVGSSPRETLAQLEEKWESANQPKPLAGYDIPVQWILGVASLVGGAFMFLHIVRIASKKYTWDEAEMRLGLPGGVSLIPTDIDVFDRRKWDKFLIFLKISAEHKELGGKEIKLDLYQYEPLEEWYTTMHKHVRPEDFAEEDEAEPDSEQDSEQEPEQDQATESEEDKQPQEEG